LGINVQYRGTCGGSNIPRAVKTIIARSSEQVGQKYNCIHWNNIINIETKQFQYQSSSKLDQSCLLNIGPDNLIPIVTSADCVTTKQIESIVKNRSAISTQKKCLKQLSVKTDKLIEVPVYKSTSNLSFINCRSVRNKTSDLVEHIVDNDSTFVH